MKQAIIKIIIFFNFAFNQAFSQKLIYSEMFNGSVEHYNINPYDSSIIEINSNINFLHKAFLISQYQKIANDLTKPLWINSNVLNLNENFLFFNNNFVNKLSINEETELNITFLDITDLLFVSNSNIIKTFSQFPNNSLIENENLLFTNISLLMLFKDNSQEKVGINIYSFDRQTTGNDSVQIQFNNINFNKDIGLGIQQSWVMNTNSDGSLISINNNLVGLIGQKDDFECNNLLIGVINSQYNYIDGQINGICDDTANYNMTNVDALAKINPFLLNNFEIKLNIKYQLFETNPLHIGNYSNPIVAVHLLFTPNCEVFETETSRDTVICLGESVPLFASGGQAYEWEPQIGLSCYDCPNPIFNHDSTITYTVRIWNNDSCSKVLPVRVRVHKPQAPQISTTPSLCADSTGSVTFWGLSEFNAPYTYQLLGVSNANGSFANVPPGAHTYSITDKYGCVYEGTVTVGVIPPKAQFTANPEQGQEPLTVTFNNSSQNANSYIWIIGTDTFYTQTHTHTFDTAGQYQVLLIAYNNNPECADTALFTVNVFAQFYVLIPNIFTPNGDGVNDEFSFEASRIREAEWEIFNRWGSTLHKGVWKTEQAFYNDTHIILVWNGTTQRNEPALDGVYFYKITVKTLNNVFETFTGNVSIVR